MSQPEFAPQATVAIVGAGLAALRAAESLRDGGFSGRILVFGEESHLPYTRPPLSKKLLKDGPSETAVAFALRDNVGSVEWRIGEHVEAADLDARTLRTAAGVTVPFDALVAATGVRPRRLPLPGPEAGRHVLRTIEDAAELHELLNPGVRVTIIGAGFIGCEVAATARSIGCDVTVVAADPEAMIRPLGPLVGASIRRRHEARGIRFLLGRGLVRYTGEGRVDGVELDDGSVIESDLVIEAIGSACNTEWLIGNGIDLTDGVLTDGFLRVDHPTPVVAVGDVARFPNALFDETPRRIEHWQLATETGRLAARTLLADLIDAEPPATPLAPVPYFWTDQGDLKVQSFGAPNLADRIEVLEGDLDSDCAIGYFAGERLVATVLFGMNARAPHYRSLVANPVRSAVAP